MSVGELSLPSLQGMYVYDGLASTRSTSSTMSSCLVLRLNLRSSTGPGAANHTGSVVPFGERRANLKKRSCGLQHMARNALNAEHHSKPFPSESQAVVDLSVPTGWTSKLFYSPLYLRVACRVIRCGSTGGDTVLRQIRF